MYHSWMVQKVMTTSEVRDYLGVKTTAYARVVLYRWRKKGLIEATGRVINGEKTWPADQVRVAAANRPGRGARTDLTKEK